MKHRPPPMRDRIIAVAVDLYLHGGLKDVTMRRIARGLRLTPMALYRHFKNKEEILLAIIEKGFIVFGEYQFRALAGKTAAERMWLAGETYTAFILEKPEFFRVLFMAPDIFEQVELTEAISERAQQMYQFLLDRVSESIREGFLKANEPEDLARTIWAMCHGMGSLYVGRLIDTDAEGFRIMFLKSFSHLGSGILIDAATQ